VIPLHCKARVRNVAKMANGSHRHDYVVSEISPKLNKPQFCDPDANFLQFFDSNSPELDCQKVHQDYRPNFDIGVLEEPRGDLHDREFVLVDSRQVSIVSIVLVERICNQWTV
jgi:hypothetical protein